MDKLEGPSPVRTNALALISEIEKPVSCPADSAETICLAQHYQAKTEAALAGLKSIVRIDEQREGVIADMQKRIDIRGGIISDLTQVDKNSQRIDTLGQDSKLVYEAQHRDDRQTIGDLQEKLDSCRSNQKWVFGGGALAGGVIAWKVKGSSAANTVLQFNPFATTPAPMTMNFSQFQTTADELARQALSNFKPRTN